MISEISIQNFKSVEKLTLPLGRVSVLIGENGAGKSNILEAVAFMGAAAANKLDSEFLVSRGIRLTDDDLMLCAFEHSAETPDEFEHDTVAIGAQGESGLVADYRLYNINKTHPGQGWGVVSPYLEIEEGSSYLARIPAAELERAFRLAPPPSLEDKALSDWFRAFYHLRVRNKEQNTEFGKRLNLSRFLVYSPENSVLRRFEEEGQIQPVGIRGEGLFKMLQTFGREDHADRLAELKESLELIGWFLDFRVPPNLAPGESRLQIIDRFLGDNVPLDQRSANEGFLFLLFYFAVFLSKSTPAFFAIDNVDASLNPRLCAELMRRLVELAKKYDKQVILTTHNPAILDGLNLLDEDQRLFSIYRTHEGRTRARRIAPPRPQPDEMPVRLSEAFLRGLLGGVPKNF